MASIDTIAHPVQIIILGGSGDLAKRKLLPALFHLYLQDQLPETFSIIGFARSERSNEEYRKLVHEAVVSLHHPHNLVKLNTFLENITYVQGTFDELESYTRLNEYSDTYETEHGCVNRLIYLAVPPKYYEIIFEHIHASQLAARCDDVRGWSRILIEKPFGRDYQSARALDEKLSSLFKEEQIFRIDHYLAKEAVQNILSFRFANPTLMPAWNHEYIESVHIEMKEKIDIGERGNFYEDVGALRDVGQNHLLQILALITMNQPARFDAEAIRRERAYMLSSLRTYSKDDCKQNVIRAQYKGFLDIPGIDCSSDTETYFELKTFVDNDTWTGVPFYISAGKALDEAEVRVTITFKNIAQGLFESADCTTKSNKITLSISPNQSMGLTLNTKGSGLAYEVETTTLSFEREIKDPKIKNAYEKVLLDCISGDQTLFTSTEEVLAAWKYVTSILESWGDVPLQEYKKGSRGPEHSLLDEI